MERAHRLPTLAWPRDLPVDGEPADVIKRVEEYGTWLKSSPQFTISAELRERGRPRRSHRPLAAALLTGFVVNPLAKPYSRLIQKGETGQRPDYDRAT